jgi:sporulation protein YlmC with PRC-barrel domain
MPYRTSAEIGFVNLSDSDFELEHREQDISGKDVYDVDGEHIGRVDALYIDGFERRVRFVEVSAGGVLGIAAKKHFLVPVESITEVGEARVTIEPGRSEQVTGSWHFDPKVVAPTTTYQRRRQDPDEYGNTPTGTPPRT